MSCDELLRLRTQARQVKLKMDDQRRKAQTKAAIPRQNRPSGKSEFLPYLQRKLARLSARIEAHVAEHQCQK
jgi:hypothetical protein